MARTFFYARVSTQEQTTDNQTLEAQSSGFAIEPHRIFEEQISGSTRAADRPIFNAMRAKMEQGDVLVITKLDRLGRNATDVRSTIEALASDGIRVHCLQLGGADLTSAAGKLTMGVLIAVAEFERDLLIERTNAGLIRTKAKGTKLGRPPAFNEDQLAEVRARHAAGTSIGQLSRDYGKARAVIQRAIKPSNEK